MTTRAGPARRPQRPGRALEHELELRRPVPAPARFPARPAAGGQRRSRLPTRRLVRHVATPRRDSIDWSELLGAKALAIAGGVVTLLGVVFCFVLAVNHGWLGPRARRARRGRLGRALRSPASSSAAASAHPRRARGRRCRHRRRLRDAARRDGDLRPDPDAAALVLAALIAAVGLAPRSLALQLVAGSA